MDLSIISETRSFLEATGLPMPIEDWRIIFKETVLATKSFLTNTPPAVMQLPVIHDSQEAMRYNLSRACDGNPQDDRDPGVIGAEDGKRVTNTYLGDAHGRRDDPLWFLLPQRHN